MRSRARAFAGVMLLAVLPASAGGGYWYSQKQESRRKAAALTNGDPDRAPALVVRYGCAGCHSVPGVRSLGGSRPSRLATLRGANSLPEFSPTTQTTSGDGS
jgi:hypothetical protein